MDAVVTGTGEAVFVLPISELDLYGRWYLFGNTKIEYEYSELEFLEDINTYFY